MRCASGRVGWSSRPSIARVKICQLGMVKLLLLLLLTKQMKERERERNRKKECLLTYLLAYLASLNHRPFLRFYLAKNKRCSFWPNLHKLTGEQVLLDGAGFRWFSHRQQQWTGQWNAAMAVLAGLHTSLWLLFPSSKLSDWEGER